MNWGWHDCNAHIIHLFDNNKDGKVEKCLIFGIEWFHFVFKCKQLKVTSNKYGRVSFDICSMNMMLLWSEQWTIGFPYRNASIVCL